MKYLLYFLILLLSCSCSVILNTVLGVKELSEINEENYQDFLNSCYDTEFNMISIHSDSSFVVEAASLGFSKKYRDLLQQPMRAYLFDEGDLVFFVANCQVPPKIPSFNLDWNYQDKFEVFPPKNRDVVDSFGIDLYVFTEKNKDMKELDQFKYIYIVNWSLTMKRQSRNLIKEVKRNINRFNLRDSTILILNNNDEMYLNQKAER